MKPLLMFILLLAGCSAPPKREAVSWEELDRESKRALELKAKGRL